MDEDEVAVQRQAPCLQAIPLAIDVAVLGGQRRAVAVEGVVHLLRDVEEGKIPLHDLPGRGDAELVHDSDDAMENLSHAAAGLGRVHHHDAAAAEPSRQMIEPAS